MAKKSKKSKDSSKPKVEKKAKKEKKSFDVVLTDLVGMLDGATARNLRMFLRKEFPRGEEATHGRYGWMEDDPELADIQAAWAKRGQKSKSDEDDEED